MLDTKSIKFYGFHYWGHHSVVLKVKFYFQKVDLSFCILPYHKDYLQNLLIAKIVNYQRYEERGCSEWWHCPWVASISSADTVVHHDLPTIVLHWVSLLTMMAGTLPDGFLSWWNILCPSWTLGLAANHSFWWFFVHSQLQQNTFEVSLKHPLLANECLAKIKILWQQVYHHSLLVAPKLLRKDEYNISMH